MPNLFKEKLSKFFTVYAAAGLGLMVVASIPEFLTGHHGDLNFKLGASWKADMICLVLFGWMASLGFLVWRFISSESFREQAFKSLSGIQERDEREEALTGEAARAYFFFSLALLLILAFASTLHFQVITEGANRMYSVTFGDFELLRPALIESRSEAAKSTVVYGNPISSTGVLLGLALTQVMAFRWFYRRKTRI